MQDVKIGDNSYRVAKLPAIKQLNLARKLTPVVAGMGSMIGAFDAENLEQIANSLKDFKPFADALAAMPDEQFEGLMLLCLTAVSRQSGSVFTPLLASNGAMMFDDVDLPTLLQLIWVVIQENVLGYFLAPASNSTAPSRLVRH